MSRAATVTAATL